MHSFPYVIPQLWKNFVKFKGQHLKKREAILAKL